MREWFEELGVNCPPAEAIQPDGKLLYRLVMGGQISDKSFYSKRKEGAKKPYPVSECIFSAVSLWDSFEQAKDLSLLPRFRKKGAIVCELILHNQDGLIADTLSLGHWSWWRSNSFSLTSTRLIP